MPPESSPSPPDLEATAAILSRIRGGDALAREDLFRRFEAPLLRFLHGRLPREAQGLIDTQDAAQDVCSRVFRSLERFDHRGVGAFWAYLRQAALNYLRDLPKTPGRLRRAQSMVDESYAHPAANTKGPEERAVAAEDIAAFERALAILDERTREALLLRFELDAEYAVIAAECEFSSPDAARMAVTRAIERVTAEIARERRSRS